MYLLSLEEDDFGISNFKSNFEKKNFYSFKHDDLLKYKKIIYSK